MAQNLPKSSQGPLSSLVIPLLPTFNNSASTMLTSNNQGFTQGNASLPLLNSVMKPATSSISMQVPTSPTSSTSPTTLASPTTLGTSMSSGSSGSSVSTGSTSGPLSIGSVAISKKKEKAPCPSCGKDYLVQTLEKNSGVCGKCSKPNDKVPCPGCQNVYTQKTLDKYSGICGKCSSGATVKKGQTQGKQSSQSTQPGKQSTQSSQSGKKQCRKCKNLENTRSLNKYRGACQTCVQQILEEYFNSGI